MYWAVLGWAVKVVLVIQVIHGQVGRDDWSGRVIRVVKVVQVVRVVQAI